MIFAVGLDRQIILTAKFSRSMVHINVFFIAAHTNKQRQGQIQRLKEGAYKKSGGWCAAVVCACIAHSVVEEFRPYESASEAIRNHHNHATLWQLECNSAESSFLRSPFLWNHQHCHKNYLLGAADLSTINECTKMAILTF